MNKVRKRKVPKENMANTQRRNRRNQYRDFLDDLDNCKDIISFDLETHKNCSKVLIDRKNWEDNYLSIDDYVEESFMDTIGLVFSNYVNILFEEIDKAKTLTSLELSISTSSYFNIIIQRLLYITDQFTASEEFSNDISISRIEKENVETKRDLDKHFIANIKRIFLGMKESFVSYGDK